MVDVMVPHNGKHKTLVRRSYQSKTVTSNPSKMELTVHKNRIHLKPPDTNVEHYYGAYSRQQQYSTFTISDLLFITHHTSTYK